MTTSPLLSVKGAVADTKPASVAAHYGNPLAEQKLLAAGRSFVDLSHNSVITITGEDRLTWLNSLTSQKIDTLQPGESQETLFLDAHGHIEHAVGLLDDGNTAYLLIESARASSLLSWLESMRFTLRVEPKDATNEFATIAMMTPENKNPAIDPKTLGVAERSGTELIWSDPWHTVTPGGYQYATTTPHPAQKWHWQVLLIERANLSALAQKVEEGTLTVAGLLAAEALRIEAWRPRYGNDVDAKTLPHELDWLRTAVHLTKGCYRGQETVAKAHNVGHPPRRLVMLHLDGSESTLPAQGDIVTQAHNGTVTTIGHITSAALHYELGPIALAMIKRRAAPDVPVLVEHNDVHIAGTQQIIVPPDAGNVAQVPRLPRLAKKQGR